MTDEIRRGPVYDGTSETIVVRRDYLTKLTARCEYLEPEYQRLQSELFGAGLTIDALTAERDELAEQVQRFQVGQEYDVGYEHGSLVAVKFKERAEKAEAERDALRGERDALIRLLYRIRNDRPSAHTDEIWLEIGSALDNSPSPADGAS